VDLDREATVRCRYERAAPDPDGLGDELPLALPVADMLDDCIREHDVELAVSERELARVALHVADPRVALSEAGAVVKPECGDPLGPRIVLLEEVQRPAAVALTERELVDTDVEHRGLRGRVQLLEEEAELPLPRAQRDLVDEPHRR
jgi:hypothetical protein